MKLAFYGDDFTGSTDALEVLAFAGLECAMFLEPPTPAMLERFGALDAIGVAGASRAMTPDEMRAALPSRLQALARLAPIVHYKVCSTFDSAPAIGSIGTVIEIARRGGAFANDMPVPIVAGNPALGRYCLFGHLFARSGTDGQVYRIDRHPIMSVHPVTPMGESDLALHIAQQAELKIAKRTLPELAQESVSLKADADALLIDSATPQHLSAVGRALDEAGHATLPLFVVGSSGVEYALTQCWRAQGFGSAETSRFERFDAAGPVLVVSASASALSATQIDTALRAGFAELPLNAVALADEQRGPALRDELAAEAARILAQGRSVIVHSARGPADRRIAELVESLMKGGLTRAEAQHRGGRALGVRLGELTRAVLARQPLKRIVLSGGDTSSEVTRALAPEALTVVARLSPGAPLCRLHGGEFDGLEVALKGGQMGDAFYFERARDGSKQFNSQETSS